MKIVCVNPPAVVKCFLRLLTGKGKKKPVTTTGKVADSAERSSVPREGDYALSILSERRQRVQTYTSSVPPVDVLTLTF